jgi:multicomponent Na+:H+ antiporter subunit G
MDLFISFLIFVGVSLQLVAALGLLRFPQFIYRLQASSKASTLGLGLVLLATALHFGTWAVALKSLTALLFLSLTSPAISTYLARVYFGPRKKSSPKTDHFDDSKNVYSTKV